MKKFKVTTLGIAVIDIIASPADRSMFERDNTIVEDIAIYPGGDACNQSVDLSKLDIDSSLCCRVGSDSFGNMLLSELKSRGVDTTHVVVSSESVTSVAIVMVSGSGDRNIVCRKGNNFDFCIDDIDMKAIAGADALSIASIYGMPKLEEDGLLEVLKCAKDNGVLTFADMASDKKGLKLGGLTPFLPYIDYFMPSEAESVYLTDCDDCREAAGIFKDMGAGNVIIKLGARGAYALCRDYTGFTDSFVIDARDTTGAGDAFCSGFIYSILNGFPIRKALEFACACGAYNSLYNGACESPMNVNAIKGFIEKRQK